MVCLKRFNINFQNQIALYFKILDDPPIFLKSMAMNSKKFNAAYHLLLIEIKSEIFISYFIAFLWSGLFFNSVIR
jgi:hypothetical protein